MPAMVTDCSRHKCVSLRLFKKKCHFTIIQIEATGIMYKFKWKKKISGQYVVCA